MCNVVFGDYCKPLLLSSRPEVREGWYFSFVVFLVLLISRFGDGVQSQCRTSLVDYKHAALPFPRSLHTAVRASLAQKLSYPERQPLWAPCPGHMDYRGKALKDIPLVEQEDWNRV
jgi:hypothetical protein